jgi:hypothetical protein
VLLSAQRVREKRCAGGLFIVVPAFFLNIIVRNTITTDSRKYGESKLKNYTFLFKNSKSSLLFNFRSSIVATGRYKKLHLGQE